MSHYVKIPMRYTFTVIFTTAKIDSFCMKNCDIFLIFAQNIEVVVTSTHNICFKAKKRRRKRKIMNNFANPCFTI